MGNCQQQLCYNEQNGSKYDNNLPGNVTRSIKDTRSSKSDLFSFPDMKLVVKDEDHPKSDLDYWKSEVRQLDKVNLQNGGTFHGEMKDGKKNGFGILELSDGTKYEGKFSN